MDDYIQNLIIFSYSFMATINVRNIGLKESKGPELIHLIRAVPEMTNPVFETGIVMR
ncbi:MAG: hypothetical protein ACP5NL_02840 [Thermoplasmata archaeon]